MTDIRLDEIAMTFAVLACEAGSAILRMREAGAPPRQKQDGSPVTPADLEADRLIRAGLARLLPNIAVVTEEAVDSHSAHADQPFILVDPLDGTREFVEGRGEYTVNIALVRKGEPIAGAICAPALNRLYVAGERAWRADMAAAVSMPRLDTMQPIKARRVPERDWCAVASRSHLDRETETWLNSHPVARFSAAGSSLKFCAIAEGEADVYPRLSPTMAWDTAAGHAILHAAGGAVERPGGEPLRYGNSDFRNPAFIAWGNRP